MQPDGHPIYAADASDMAALLTRYPRLTEEGLDGTIRMTGWLKTGEAIAQVNHCIAFLISFTQVKSPNANAGSQDLRLLAEHYGTRDVTRIANGAMVAAGLHLHLARRIDEAANTVMFGISEPERRWVLNDSSTARGPSARKPRHWDLFQEYRRARGGTAGAGLAEGIDLAG